MHHFDTTELGIPPAPELAADAQDMIETVVTLFGWDVVEQTRHARIIHDDGRRARVSQLWSLVSRWSPPRRPLGLGLYECFGPYGRQLWRIEVVTVLGPGLARSLSPRLLWTSPTDERGYPIYEESSLETFVAGLGRFRTRPATALSSL